MTKHKGVRPAISFNASAAPRANPALWGYGVGATLIVLGLLVLSIALGSALRSATRGMVRVTLPGMQVLALKEGLHVAILPGDGKSALPDPSEVEISLLDENGVEVPRVPFPPEMAQANRKIGTTLFQAMVPADGRYVLKGRLPAEAKPADMLLIHESISRNSADILVGAILMAVLGGFGLYILIITYRRNRPVPAPGGSGGK